MEIPLHPDAEQFIRQQVLAGKYRSVGDVVQRAIDLLEQLEQHKSGQAGAEKDEERQARMRVQEAVAAKVLDNAPDAVYDAPRRSPEGILVDIRIDVSDEEFQALRREMWDNFPRDDI